MSNAAITVALMQQNALKAMGSIVSVTPDDFRRVVSKNEDALVIFHYGGTFKKHYKYLTTYKGFTFYTKSDSKLSFNLPVEIVEADKISIPDL
jgi:hypothetical protein